MTQELTIAITVGLNAILFVVFKTTYAGVVKSKFDESLESVKSGFTKDVEKLKSDLALNVNSEVAKLQASLSKNNIGYQIHTAEYTKYKFDKVVKMYVSVIEAGNVSSGFREAIELTMSDEEALKKRENALKAIWKIQDQLTETSLFINGDLEKIILNYLNSECITLDRVLEINDARNIYNKISIDMASDGSEELKNAHTAVQVAENNYDRTIIKYAEWLQKLKDGFKAELSGAELIE